MASDNLLKKIFEHQLLLSREIKTRLKDYLTDDLNGMFTENETYLEQLLVQESISSQDLEKLQRLWENLTTEIQKIKKDATQRINVLQAEEAVNQLYADQK